MPGNAVYGMLMPTVPDLIFDAIRWPLAGSPGRAVEPVAAEPLPEGEGELAAIVDIAVRTMKAGIPNASTIPRDTRIEAKSYLG